MLYFAIDRFEGGFAVCETPEGKLEHVARELLPPDAAEGDLLVREDGQWRVDRQATKARRAAILEKRARLPKKKLG